MPKSVMQVWKFHSPNQGYGSSTFQTKALLSSYSMICSPAVHSLVKEQTVHIGLAFALAAR